MPRGILCGGKSVERREREYRERERESERVGWIDGVGSEGEKVSRWGGGREGK